MLLQETGARLMNLHWLKKTVLWKFKYLSLKKKQGARIFLPSFSSLPSPLSALCPAKMTKWPSGSAENFWLCKSWQNDKVYVKFISSSWISPFVLTSAEQRAGVLERGQMWLWPSLCSLWPQWKFAQLSFCKQWCSSILSFSCITSWHFLPLVH